MKIKAAKFLFLFTLFPNVFFGQVLITGQVLHTKEKELYIYYPINGFGNTNVLQSKSIVKIDSFNQFRFQLGIDSPAFITLSVKNEPVWLMINKDDTLSITINLDSVSKNSNWLTIKGKNSQGHLYFNRYNFSPFDKYVAIKEIFNDISFNKDNIIQVLLNTINKELRPLDSLFTFKIIDSIYYKTVRKSLEANFFTEAISNFLKRAGTNNFYNFHQSDSIINQIFKICNPADIILRKGLQTNYYFDDYFYIQALKTQNKKFNEQLKDTVVTIGNTALYISSEFIPYLYIKDSVLRENLWGRKLFDFLRLFDDQIKREDFDSFKAFFPKSKWLKYINSLYVENQRQGFNTEGVTFLDTTLTIDSMDSLISKFKNRPIFLDIWATWCIPCRQEFTYNHAIDSFLNAHKITRLYVSIDNPLLKNTWKNVIGKYRLKGYHVIASPALIKSINEVIYGHSEFLIPRYAIINKKGRIIENNAHRPSEGDILIKELSKKLSIEEK
jgi:thiol-disulfide isomerase/thioredoxin